MMSHSSCVLYTKLSSCLCQICLEVKCPCRWKNKESRVFCQCIFVGRGDTEWRGEEIMNCELTIILRVVVRAYLKLFSQNLCGNIQKSFTNTQSRYPLTWSRHELVTCLIQVQNIVTALARVVRNVRRNQKQFLYSTIKCMPVYSQKATMRLFPVRNWYNDCVKLQLYYMSDAQFYFFRLSLAVSHHQRQVKDRNWKIYWMTDSTFLCSDRRIILCKPLLVNLSLQHAHWLVIICFFMNTCTQIQPLCREHLKLCLRISPAHSKNSMKKF